LVEVKCDDISLVVSSGREKIEKVAILPEDIYLSDIRPLGYLQIISNLGVLIKEWKKIKLF